MTSKSRSRRTLADHLGLDVVPTEVGLFKGSKYKPTLDSQTLVGIEIEVENGVAQARREPPSVGMPDMFNAYWSTTADGSLRNHGVEFVSRRGLNAQELSVGLQVLEDYIRYYYPAMEANARTGVHIHVNCLPLCVEQIQSVIAVYSLVERSLFKGSGKRMKNIFCVPVRESDNVIPQLLRVRTVGQLHGLARNSPKYMAFNVGALHSHGTIEFRHGAGTAKPTEVLPWLETVTKLFDYATSREYSELLTDLKALNTNSRYEELARDIFPMHFIQTVGYHNIVSDMVDGCAFIKEALIEEEGADGGESPLDELRVEFAREGGRFVDRDPLAAPLEWNWGRDPEREARQNQLLNRLRRGVQDGEGGLRLETDAEVRARMGDVVVDRFIEQGLRNLEARAEGLARWPGVRPRGRG